MIQVDVRLKKREFRENTGKEPDSVYLGEEETLALKINIFNRESEVKLLSFKPEDIDLEGALFMGLHVFEVKRKNHLRVC